jgi:hypothetical protein
MLRRLAIASLAALLVAVPAAARSHTDVSRSPDLWATVNLCDVPNSPHDNVIGIRGSMPGLGRRASVWMRFQVQYLKAADHKWHNIEQNADSGYQKLGIAAGRVVESGWSFKFLPPPGGGAHTLRGAVTFVWKRHGKTVRRIRKLTESGHRSTKGADPPGYSEASCLIS